MSKISVILSTLLMVAAKAAPLNYQAGDLFLAVRATEQPGATVAYVVNLGPASAFRDAGGDLTVSGLGALASDLAAAYGADWHSRPDVRWSVFGTAGISGSGGDSARTLYASRERPASTTASTPWKRANANAQAAPTNLIASLGSSFRQTAGVVNESTANSPVGFFQDYTSVNSYGSFQTTASSFSYFSPTIEADVSTPPQSQLDFYRLAPASGAAVGTDGTYLGTFALSATGTLTFSKLSAGGSVPPPEITVLPAAGQPTTVTILFRGAASTSFAVQRSGDLVTWSTLTTASTDGAGRLEWSDPTPPQGAAYYRLTPTP